MASTSRQVEHRDPRTHGARHALGRHRIKRFALIRQRDDDHRPAHLPILANTVTACAVARGEPIVQWIGFNRAPVHRAPPGGIIRTLYPRHAAWLLAGTRFSGSRRGRWSPWASSSWATGAGGVFGKVLMATARRSGACRHDGCDRAADGAAGLSDRSGGPRIAGLGTVAMVTAAVSLRRPSKPARFRHRPVGCITIAIAAGATMLSH